MNAIEWLSDLEKKADDATPGPWKRIIPQGTDIASTSTRFFVIMEGIIDEPNVDFIAAANPETVKRLVEMVKIAACLLGCPHDDERCPYDEDNTVTCAQCKTKMIYDLTEPKQ